MSEKVQDLILKRLDEVSDHIDALRTQMHKEHAELRERVIRLEHDNKVTRWIWAGAGAVLAVCIRELLPRIFS